jgi:hypothetical protein
MGPKGMRVAVLFHARERRLDPALYLVHHLARLWREDGLEVVDLYGTDRFVPADLVLVHVDLSVVPEPYLEFAAHYPIVLNGRVCDIRKTVTSRYLVRPGDDWDGPVIVKTDLNCGGYPGSLTGLRRLRAVRAVARRLGAAATWHDYRIFERLADVPAPLVENPDLVLERFLPDIEDGLYRTHMYLFLGDGERCSRLGSPEPVFKADTSTTACAVEPHAEARAWREEIGLDYGKIDYIVREGEVILLDANKTTGSSTYVEPATLGAERRRQADGIHAYFAGLKPL